MVDLLGIIVFLSVLLVSGLLVARSRQQGKLQERLQWYRLRFPRDLTPDNVGHFLTSLRGLIRPRWKTLLAVPSIVLEVAAEPGGIEYRLGVPRPVRDYVLSELRTAAPGLRIEPADPPTEQALVLAGEFRRFGWDGSLRVEQPEAVTAGLLAALTPLRKDEQLLVQWILLPSAPRRPRQGTTSARQDKQLREPGFLAVVRIATRAGSPKRARQLLRRLNGAFHSSQAPDARLQRRIVPARLTLRATQCRLVPLLHFPCWLKLSEVVALLGWPIGAPQLPGLDLRASRQLPPSSQIPRHGRPIGTANFPGSERELALTVEASFAHTHVIGSTGVGKSTWLLNQIVSDIQAGHGVAVFDPAGQLVADVLDRLPPGREKDVVWFDPADEQWPVGLNVLEATARSTELTVDFLVSLIRRQWPDSWGPRLEQYLRAALSTLAIEPGHTLIEVPRLLADDTFRRRLISRLDEPIVLEPLWAAFGAMSPQERAAVSAPIVNKVTAFSGRPQVRNIVGQGQSTLDMDAVLAEGKVLLVALARGVIGEGASTLLGSMLLARLWAAVQARASLDRPRPFFCFIDEVQQFTDLPGSSLADVLAMARKWRFGLVMAHQYLQQLPPSVRKGLGNARTKVCFQVSADDAKTLAREFAPFVTADDLRNLGPYEVVVAACLGAEVAPPTTALSSPPPPVTGRGDAARSFSRQQFAKPREQVEREIRQRHGAVDGEGPVRRRQR